MRLTPLVNRGDHLPDQSNRVRTLNVLRVLRHPSLRVGESRVSLNLALTYRSRSSPDSRKTLDYLRAFARSPI